MELWPDNIQVYELFRRVGTRWRLPPMGGVPVGLQWEAIYPLMDRLGLEDAAWSDMHDSLMSLETYAIEVMQEFAPKNER